MARIERNGAEGSFSAITTVRSSGVSMEPMFW